MDEEVKGFNRYMSKVDFQPVTEFIFQNGQLTDYKKGEFFSRQNESCKMVGYVTEGSFRYCCTDSREEVRLSVIRLITLLWEIILLFVWETILMSIYKLFVIVRFM